MRVLYVTLVCFNMNMSWHALYVINFLVCFSTEESSSIDSTVTLQMMSWMNAYKVKKEKNFFRFLLYLKQQNSVAVLDCNQSGKSVIFEQSSGKSKPFWLFTADRQLYLSIGLYKVLLKIVKIIP